MKIEKDAVTFENNIPFIYSFCFFVANKIN